MRKSFSVLINVSAISGAASVLLSSEEIASSERSASLVRDIKSDADALSAMVENLLSITKIRDGVMPLNKQEEMLEEVAGDALLTMRRRFPDCPIALELSDDILYLPMEPMLIKQVIVNLLENAIRHSGDREHIRLRLIDAAKERIADPARSIAEVAYELGFKYPAHFTRLFKNVVGCTPNRYRNIN